MSADGLLCTVLHTERENCCTESKTVSDIQFAKEMVCIIQRQKHVVFGLLVFRAGPKLKILLQTHASIGVELHQ